MVRKDVVTGSVDHRPLISWRQSLTLFDFRQVPFPDCFRARRNVTGATLARVISEDPEIQGDVTYIN